MNFIKKHFLKKHFLNFLKKEGDYQELMLSYLICKKNVSKYHNTVSAGTVVRSKVENFQFYCGGVIWATRLSGAFGHNQVLIGIFIIAMNKLHYFLFKFCKSKMT